MIDIFRGMTEAKVLADIEMRCADRPAWLVTILMSLAAEDLKLSEQIAHLEQQREKLAKASDLLLEVAA